MLVRQVGRLTAARANVRAFATAVPLDQPFPGIGESKPVDLEFLNAPPAVSTIGNGVRAVTKDLPQAVASVSVFINAGSRHELEHELGATHLLEQMAFKSTDNRSQVRTVRELEGVGAYTAAQAQQNSIVFSAECMREDVPFVMDVLADTVKNREFQEHELVATKEHIAGMLKDLAMNPHAMVLDDVTKAAYGHRGLGSSVLAQAKNLPLLDDRTLANFASTHFTSNRIVVAAAGVDHESFVAQVEDKFGDIEKGDASLVAGVASPYVGGEVRTPLDVHATHMAVAFEAVGLHDKDFLPLLVLQTLLGGGGSFSAGGPGKGMYSRLYLNVLNRFHWAQSISAFCSTFEDTGVFGIYGLADPAHGHDLTNVICDELQKMATTIHPVELSRAKNQLRTSLMMNLETRSVTVEDIGRQVLCYGAHKAPSQICAEIDAITGNDLTRVAKRMLSSTPTVAAAGDVYRNLPTWENISKNFA